MLPDGIEPRIKIKELQGKYPLKRFVIACNGPGLNYFDLQRLRDQGDYIIGLNRIYLDFTPDILVCVNDVVFSQWGPEILAADCPKILPERFFKTFAVPEDVYTIRTRGEDVLPKFQNDLTGPVWEGHTVTFVALQVAAWLSYTPFAEVAIIGMDHNYGEIKGNPNQEAVQLEDDNYHYRPDYFPKGSRWNLPDLKTTEHAYMLAADSYSLNITNYSTPTACRVFPLAENPNQIYDWEKVEARTSRGTYTVSAIVSAYHSRKYFMGLLEDLKNQSLYEMKELEIVIVCRKGSYEHRIALKNTCEHMQIILTDDIPTVYEAWNLGIKAANGEYLTNANTDDRRSPLAYEIMSRYLRIMRHVDLVYADQAITWRPNQTLEEFTTGMNVSELVKGRQKGKPGLFVWPEYDLQLLKKGCYIGPMPMWRANLHSKHGYFDPWFTSSGDWEFWLRIAKPDNMYHIPYVLGLYYVNQKGAELRDPKRRQKEDLRIIHQYTEDDIEMRVLNADDVVMFCGDNYAIVEREGLKAMLHQVLSKQDEMNAPIPKEKVRDALVEKFRDVEVD